MFPLPKAYLIRIILEIILTVIVLIVPLKLYKFWGPTTKRGFFCDDESIKYPYHEDTVNTELLYLYGDGIPIMVIIIGEFIKHIVLKPKDLDIVHDLWKLLLMCHEYITPFLFFMSCSHLVTNVIKFSIGRLRPHFLAVCQPQRLADNSTCADVKNHGIYIRDYVCQPHSANITKFMQINAHHSFPSGHSIFIFYGMIFTVLYLQRFSKCLHHQHKLNFGLLIPLLQMLCVLLASFVAASRVVDYKHHWSDVLVGVVLGTSVAIAVSFYVQQQITRVTAFLEGSNNDTSMPDTEMPLNTPLPNPIILP